MQEMKEWAKIKKQYVVLWEARRNIQWTWSRGQFVALTQCPPNGTDLHTVGHPTCLSLICTALPHHHSLAGICGTLVIFYIYPLRLLLPRMIIVPCGNVHSRPRRLTLLQPTRVVFGCRGGDQGDVHDKNNNPLLIHAAKAQQLARPSFTLLQCVCVCVCCRKGQGGNPTPLHKSHKIWVALTTDDLRNVKLRVFFPVCLGLLDSSAVTVVSSLCSVWYWAAVSSVPREQRQPLWSDIIPSPLTQHKKTSFYNKIIHSKTKT